MGYFKIYRNVDDMLVDKNCLANIHNTFVDSGKIYALERIWRISDWFDPLNDYMYIRVGSSTNTNAGVVGPTISTPIANNGAWQGVSPTDWKLSSPLTSITPAAVQIIRSGKTIHLYATISSTSEEDVFEFGVFLDDTIAFPSADPCTGGSEDDKENAMICRAVNYYSEGGQYKTNALTVSATESLTIRYIFDDFEG